jgi:hypothetical protein
MSWKSSFCTTNNMWFEMSLWKQRHLYVSLTASYCAYGAICIKCYDSERHMNCSSHFVALSTIIVTIITSASSDTASLSSFMICRSTGTTTWHCQTNWVPVLRNPFSEIPVAANPAERSAARFSYLLAVPMVAAVECLDAMQLHRTVLMRWT